MAGRLQDVASRDAPWRMQKINVSRTVSLGMERTLHHERPDMTPANQARLPITSFKPKLKLCTPTIDIQGSVPPSLR
jgi:hypothetical protein